jgi:hypothetical protein
MAGGAGEWLTGPLQIDRLGHGRACPPIRQMDCGGAVRPCWTRSVTAVMLLEH